MTITAIGQIDAARHVDARPAGKRRIALALVAVLLGVLACFLARQSVVIVEGVTTSRLVAGQFICSWLAFIGMALSAGFAWDLSRSETLLTEVKRAKFDIAIALGLVVLAGLIRLVGPVTGADDELLHLWDVIRLKNHPDSGGITATSLSSVPYVLDWAIFFVNDITCKFFDVFMLMKASSIAVAAGSVGAWYLISRIYFTRTISVCGGLLVSFWGWHYVNSRFI
jgi:hypothetical protein